MPKAPKAKPCPVCGKSPTPDHAPFCGPRCKDRDLLKWLGEGYRISGPPADESLPLGRVDSDEDDG